MSSIKTMGTPLAPDAPTTPNTSSGQLKRAAGKLDRATAPLLSIFPDHLVPEKFGLKTCFSAFSFFKSLESENWLRRTKRAETFSSCIICTSVRGGAVYRVELSMLICPRLNGWKWPRVSVVSATISQRTAAERRLEGLSVGRGVVSQSRHPLPVLSGIWILFKAGLIYGCHFQFSVSRSTMYTFGPIMKFTETPYFLQKIKSVYFFTAITPGESV